MNLAEAFRRYGPQRDDGDDASREQAGEVLLLELYRLSVRLGVDRALADDLVSTVALGVLNAEPGRRYPDLDESDVRAFLARALTNALWSEFRKARRRREGPLTVEPSARPFDNPEYLAALSRFAEAVEEARRVVNEVVLPAARAGVRGGEQEFDRVWELLQDVASGRTTRTAVVMAELDACRNGAEPDVSLKTVADRVDARTKRVRQRVADAAFEYLAAAPVSPTREGALAVVLEEQGVSLDKYRSRRAGRQAAHGQPRRPGDHGEQP